MVFAFDGWCRGRHKLLRVEDVYSRSFLAMLGYEIMNEDIQTRFLHLGKQQACSVSGALVLYTYGDDNFAAQVLGELMNFFQCFVNGWAFIVFLEFLPPLAYGGTFRQLLMENLLRLVQGLTIIRNAEIRHC